LLECGLLRGSFVPPPVIARLRDLTRYRTKLVQDRAREVQRVQKVLETAGIKLESVVSDVMGKAARRMIDALVAGERDAEVMADMALTRMRPKIAELQLALEGRFNDHHALMLSLHLGHIHQLTATIERLDEEVERELDPFDEQFALLCTIPGIGRRVAEVVIAEIGVDMGRFPTAAHLASWAGCVRVITSPPANAVPAAPARAMLRCGLRSAKRHGPQHAPIGLRPSGATAPHPRAPKREHHRGILVSEPPSGVALLVSWTRCHSRADLCRKGPRRITRVTTHRPRSTQRRPRDRGAAR
jgi:hypothetical protein